MIPKAAENIEPSAAANRQTIIRPSSRVPLGTIALSAVDNNIAVSSNSSESAATSPLSVSMDQNGLRIAGGSILETPTGRRKQSFKRPRMRDSWNQ